LLSRSECAKSPSTLRHTNSTDKRGLVAAAVPAGSKPAPQPPCTRAQPRRRCGMRLSDISAAVRDFEDGARGWLAVKDVLLCATLSRGRNASSQPTLMCYSCRNPMPAHKRRETPAETVGVAQETRGSYVLEWVNCGSPYCRRCSPGAAGTHGPYWYVYRWQQGNTSSAMSARRCLSLPRAISGSERLWFPTTAGSSRNSKDVATPAAQAITEAGTP
jgi:Family of unknown function (DUF6788)